MQNPTLGTLPQRIHKQDGVWSQHPRSNLEELEDKMKEPEERELKSISYLFEVKYEPPLSLSAN